MSVDKVFEALPFGRCRVEGRLVAGMFQVPPAKSEYDRGREAGLGRAADICEEYAKATMNPERARGAEILAKDIKREIERE